MSNPKCNVCYDRGEVTIDYVLPKSARFKDESGKLISSFGSHKEVCECKKKKLNYKNAEAAFGSPTSILSEEVRNTGTPTS